MSRRTTFSLLLGILILASFFRLYHITTVPPGLYPDEAMDGNNALEVLQTGHFQVFYVEDNGREGLYVNILVFFIKYLGNKPWVVRLPAAFAGILTVLGIYFLTDESFRETPFDSIPSEWGSVQGMTGDEKDSREREEKKPYSLSAALRGAEGRTNRHAIALLATFLLATSFWHINFSRIGFRAILAPLCLTWALYWFLKSIRSLRARPAALYAIAAGIIFGAGFYAYIAYRIAPVLFLLFIPFFKRYPDFWKKTVLFVAVGFVVALPIGIYFLQNPAAFFGRTSEISVTSSASPLRDLATNIVKTALMFNFHGDSNWRQNVSGAPELWWPVGILFLIGIGWGIYVLWRSRRKSGIRNPESGIRFSVLLIFSWFLLGGLPAVISDEGIPHALRSILMLPPAIMLAAIGGVWTYQASRIRCQGSQAKIIINAIAILFIIAVAVFAYVDYFIIWAQNPNVPGAFNADYVAIGDQMNALPSSTPKYVVVNAGGILARGIPVPAETVMFVTDSFTTSTQLANHITYLLPDQADQIPSSTPSSTIFYVN